MLISSSLAHVSSLIVSDRAATLAMSVKTPLLCCMRFSWNLQAVKGDVCTHMDLVTGVDGVQETLEATLQHWRAFLGNPRTQVLPLYVSRSFVQKLPINYHTIFRCMPLHKRAHLSKHLLPCGPTSSICRVLIGKWTESLGADSHIAQENLNTFVDVEATIRPLGGRFKGWEANLLVDYLDATEHLKELAEVSRPRGVSDQHHFDHFFCQCGIVEFLSST